jgi:membrane-bound inhibitor of C-type lysozyme
MTGKRGWLGFPVLCALLSAAQIGASSAQTFVNYRCADGSRFSAMFVKGADAVYLQLDGKSLTLPQRLSASGARYSKGGITLWTKGATAQLKRPARAWTDCAAF